jgi:hypothetical protein
MWIVLEVSLSETDSSAPAGDQQPVNGCELRAGSVLARVYEERGRYLMPVADLRSRSLSELISETKDRWPLVRDWRVVSTRMATTLSALGFFSQIAAGHLVFSNLAQLTNDQIVQEPEKQPDSMPAILLGDPPTRLLTHTRDGRRFDWLDCRNWCTDAARYLPNWLDEAWLLGDGADTPEIRRRQYLEQRAELVVEIVEGALRVARGLGCPYLPSTVGGIAWQSYWRTRSEERPAPCSGELEEKLLRLALAGPRSVAFMKGRLPAPVHWLDVTQQYTSVMYKYVFPVAVREIVERDSWGDLPKGEPVEGLCALALVETPPGVFACYESGTLQWPGGRYRTVLAGPELAYARDRRYLKGVGTYVSYELGAPFDEWVRRWRRLRAQAESWTSKAQMAICKQVGNSLWGRMAARASGYEYTAEIPPRYQWGVRYVSLPSRGRVARVLDLWSLVLAEVEHELLPDTSPACAAWIQSAARVQMDRWIDGIDSRCVYYLMADSIWVDGQGLYQLSHLGAVGDGEPGLLEVESTGTDVVLLSAGAYYWDGELTLTGLPLRSRAGLAPLLARDLGPKLLTRIGSGDPQRLAVYSQDYDCRELYRLWQQSWCEEVIHPRVWMDAYPDLTSWPPRPHSKSR